MSALVKICEGCGEGYRRPTGTNRVNDDRWAARRYCTARCGMHSAGRSSDGKSQGQKDAWNDRRDSAEAASKALRERILAMFANTANRKGVSLEEAAFLHLCPVRA